ncbi:hypothetical protein ILUMI_20269 [Ignelater luminosus]|uniref:Uncharacterized protein n=1 Tax=Ignelater luminosus TaxID=2038154 RepID=A0A8K0CII6_IGNLU|nr:hypothetical protein ILUMI_20269 [Ignelater luminosus]
MTKKTLSTGNYCHFGISSGLKNFLNRFPKFSSSFHKCSISLNIDGILLYNSTNTQLWPILCQIKNKSEDIQNQPFAVGIFCGNSKPSPLELCLEGLIKELAERARAYIKCIKSHSGYSSCEKCTEPGIYVDKRIILKNIFAPRRTVNRSYNKLMKTTI